MLRAGCPSEWLCTLAAMEGRLWRFRAAVKAGCPVTKDALKAAARQGHALLLKAVCSELKKTPPPSCQPTYCQGLGVAVVEALRGAIEGSHASCLELLLKAAPLLGWAALSYLCEVTMDAAVEFGQLECLKVAHRCVHRALIAFLAGGMEYGTAEEYCLSPCCAVLLC